MEKSEALEALEPDWLIAARAYPGFCSMKQLGVFNCQVLINYYYYYYYYYYYIVIIIMLLYLGLLMDTGLAVISIIRLYVLISIRAVIKF